MKDMEFNYNWASFSKSDEMTGNSRGGIYCIGNVVNKNCYIGSTVSFHDRYIKHMSSLNTGKVSIKLGEAISKYGLNNFLFFVLEYVDDFERLESREGHFVSVMGAIYNHKRKIKRHDCTPERNKKISDTLRSVVKKVNSNPLFGTKRPKELVEQIFKTRSTRKEEIYDSNSNRVVQYDLDGNFLAEYRSVNIASKLLGIARDKINRICKDNWPYKTKDQFTFKYKNTDGLDKQS